jgi:hypothetical protein
MNKEQQNNDGRYYKRISKMLDFDLEGREELDQIELLEQTIKVAQDKLEGLKTK